MSSIFDFLKDKEDKKTIRFVENPTLKMTKLSQNKKKIDKENSVKKITNDAEVNKYLNGEFESEELSSNELLEKERKIYENSLPKDELYEDNKENDNESEEEYYKNNTIQNVNNSKDIDIDNDNDENINTNEDNEVNEDSEYKNIEEKNNVEEEVILELDEKKDNNIEGKKDEDGDNDEVSNDENNNEIGGGIGDDGEDDDEDEDEEDDEENIDLDGMKKAFSDMYTNVVVSASSKSGKFKRMREEMEARRKGLSGKKSIKPHDMDKKNKSQDIDNSKREENNNPKKNKIKKENKEVVVNSGVFSEVLTFTTTRPIEIAFDLSCRYVDSSAVRIDMHAKNQDLVELVNSNLDMKYLDISDCHNIDDFSPLIKLSNLEQLNIANSKKFHNLEFLTNMTKLKVLNLDNLNLESIDNIPNFPELEVLSLKMSKIRSIDVLSKFTNLHDLVLWGCSHIHDINVVSVFKELRLLDLDGCVGVKNVEAIRYLSKLVYLNFNFLKIEDLSPIKDLYRLESFSMEFSSLGLTEHNLTHFEGLTKMKFLGLRNRVIRNLNHFSNMKELDEFQASGNVINDIRPLEDMVNMKILNLGTNVNLLDISPLHKMDKLKKLLLNGMSTPKGGSMAMMIEDVSVLRYLKSLNVFESNLNRKLRDISPIKYCTELKEFVINNCLGVSDITPLRFCTKLEMIFLENCMQIRDISFFKYLTNLQQVNIVKTSVDRMAIAGWTRLYNTWSFRDSAGNILANAMVIDSFKYRRKICKSIKGSVKEEDYKDDEN